MLTGDLAAVDGVTFNVKRGEFFPQNIGFICIKARKGDIPPELINLIWDVRKTQKWSIRNDRICSIFFL